MTGKATAIAHPIQGIVKYHGMRDDELRLPYHESISVCTAPARSKTTVAFEATRNRDLFVVDDDRLVGRDADRLRAVIDEVRRQAGTDARVRLESVNEVPTNVGFGSSSSGFAAAAMAAVAATELELTKPEISTIARRGSASAARAVTGGFSSLSPGLNDRDCRSVRLTTDLDDPVRIVAALVPTYKETGHAHAEAVESHMFDARLAHVHEQLATVRDGLRSGSFEQVFEVAEHDSLSLAATTMTGPEGWVYWSPATIEIFEAVRELREEAGVPVYFSTDTGASVYVNTTRPHVAEVADAIDSLGVETRRWEIGGPARTVDPDRAVF